MKRPFRTGLVAGLLALTLAGAACGSGSNSVAQKPAKSGGAATEALFSGAIDATFIGPSPAINGFVKSKGDALRVVAGATSGGASLVVKPNVNSAADLKGQKVATPQLGNTQDVAARAYFLSQGLKTDTQGGGDVKVVPQ